MACVQRISPRIDFTKYAAKKGLNVATIPLKDKSTVKILSNDTKFEEYYLKDGEVINSMKKDLPKFEDFSIFVADRLANIQENAIKGINVVAEWTKSLMK